MVLYRLYHNGEEVLFSKEDVHVTCKELDEHLVHHKGSIYKIGTPVLDGLKIVSIVTDTDKSDLEMINILKDFAVKSIKTKVSSAKAALEEWERYNYDAN